VSFADVADAAYQLQLTDDRLGFAVQMHPGDPVYLFTRRDGNPKLYVHNTLNPAHKLSSSEYSFVTTVEKNKARYTKRELEAAEAAQSLLNKVSGVRSSEVIRMLNEGEIKNTDVLPQDIARAIDIYGKPSGLIKGATTSRKPPIVVDDDDYVTPVVRVNQELHADLFFIEGIPFLLSILVPMRYFFVTALKSRGISDLWKAIMGHISTTKLRGIVITELRTDNEGALIALEPQLNQLGIAVNSTAAGGVVPIPEREIRQIKEKARGIANNLPYSIGRGAILVGLITYVVFLINAVVSTTSSVRLSPRTQLYGKRLDARRDLPLEFGQFVHASPDKVNNSLASRTAPCVYLHPKGNREGSMVLYNLSTGRVICRQHVTEGPMGNPFITRLNQLAAGQADKNPDQLAIGNADNLLEDEDDGLVYADEPAMNPLLPPAAMPLLLENDGIEFVADNPYADEEDADQLADYTGAPLADQEMPAPDIPTKDSQHFTPCRPRRRFNRAECG
jgi:hypothetical protein